MDNVDLPAIWEEFVLTMGMLCTSVTGRQGPAEPAALLEHAREVGVIPTDSLPLLRRASNDFKNRTWLWRPDIASEQARELLLEMFQCSGWAADRIVRKVFGKAGFTTQEAEDVPLGWSERPSGFFAQRGEWRLYVALSLCRLGPVSPTDDTVARRLFGNEYETMKAAPEVAERLPTLVIVHTGTQAGEPLHLFIESGRPDAPSRDEFLVRMDALPKLRFLLDEVFPSTPF